MRAIVALVPDRNQDAGWLAGFQDGDDLAGFGILEILLHELVAPAFVIITFGSIQNRSTPFLGSVLQPILELIGDVRQGFPGHPLAFAVGVEEPEHALGLLEWL